ncbi:integumentary mucin C.1-like [Dreissena polymorpha]|uniref:integumentary mucin C.1-like n=1 Tax=Dreissena polymorpha TaxID=45954 RepID=UPI0022647D6B|nr:integumentary mucin C.1-like [Dreissena polymorpha]
MLQHLLQHIRHQLQHHSSSFTTTPVQTMTTTPIPTTIITASYTTTPESSNTTPTLSTTPSPSTKLLVSFTAIPESSTPKLSSEATTKSSTTTSQNPTTTSGGTRTTPKPTTIAITSTTAYSTTSTGLKTPSYTTSMTLTTSMKYFGCRTPPGLLNGYFTKGETTYDSSIEYKCITGYNRIGNNTIVCLENGNWSQLMTKCEIKNCKDTPTVANGSCFSNTSTYQSVAVCLCDVGCTSSWGNYTECLASGTWADVKITCTINEIRQDVHQQIQMNTQVATETRKSLRLSSGSTAGSPTPTADYEEQHRQ